VSTQQSEQGAVMGKRSSDALPVAPFLAGAAVGAVAGVVAGTLLSRHTVHLIAALIGAVDRRVSHDERDQLPFELLLQ
jgi:hypothetical protein